MHSSCIGSFTSLRHSLAAAAVRSSKQNVEPLTLQQTSKQCTLGTSSATQARHFVHCHFPNVRGTAVKFDPAFPTRRLRWKLFLTTPHEYSGVIFQSLRIGQGSCADSKMTSCQLSGTGIEPKPTASGVAEFQLAGRSSYLRIDLDALWNNLEILRNMCFSHTEIIAVLKANAYGHGSVGIARHLMNKGITHFAVATTYEGRELRQAGIQGYIQVFALADDAPLGRKLQTPFFGYRLLTAKINIWHDGDPRLQTGVIPPVVIKVDSGLSRNGCQPEEVPRLMTLCSELGVPVHSIMTHFAQAWDDENFTRQQLQTFLTAVQPYRQQGVKVQAANSEAVIRGIGNDLDFVRPGICLFGLPPAKDEESAKFVHDLGIRPVLSWIARPNLLKVLSPGRHIGYDQTYAVEKEETIATFSIGYGDGYNPQLADKGVLTSRTGQEYPVVGKVSMDAITVKVDQDTDLSTPFFVYKDDYTSHNSLNGIARMTGNHVVQESTPLSARVPRLFVTGSTVFTTEGRAVTVPSAAGRLATVANGDGGVATASSCACCQATGLRRISRQLSGTITR
ncbi:hypothetical protein BaRGS_00022604, partial [Batillaria attramentaria]